MNILKARHIVGPDGPKLVRGGVSRSRHVIEAFRHQPRGTNLVIAGESLVNSHIDISWLGAASDTYQISADPRDYVLTDVPIVTVDIPNRNMQAFPYEELAYFDPLYGRMVYSTFVGCPTHIDHQNKDPLKAKGAIFDASMQYIPSYDVWKVRILCGWDRTKDPWLADQIVRKRRTCYSMGALVNAFLCSVCGTIDNGQGDCACMRRGKGRVMDGRLVHQVLTGVNFIENSSVDDPADITADTDSIWAEGL